MIPMYATTFMRVNTQVETTAYKISIIDTFREFINNPSNAMRATEVRIETPHPKKIFHAAYVSTGVGHGTKNMVYSCKSGSELVLFLGTPCSLQGAHIDYSKIHPASSDNTALTSLMNEKRQLLKQDLAGF
jgi:hypothetical protein